MCHCTNPLLTALHCTRMQCDYWGINLYGGSTSIYEMTNNTELDLQGFDRIPAGPRSIELNKRVTPPPHPKIFWQNFLKSTKVLKNANYPSFMTLQDLQGARASPRSKLEWDLLTQKPKNMKKHLILVENSDLLLFASKSSYG